MNPAHVLPLVMTSLISLTGCTPENKTPEILSATIVGNDRDAHNCIGSAGYTWSEVRQSCIRVWEEGVALEDKTVESSTSSAYIIAGPEHKNMELFLPIGGSVILKPTEDGKWQNTDGTYTLIENASNDLVIYNEDGGVLYVHEASKN